MIPYSELFDKIMRGVLGERNPTTGEVRVLQSDVLVMLPKAMHHIPAMCHNKFWPKLFARLRGSSTDEEMMEKIAAVHKALATMFNRTDTFTKEDSSMLHANVGEALTAVDWDSLDEDAKIIYMAVFGYYFAAGVWASATMRRMLGGYPGALGDDIVVATAETVRLADQKLGLARQARSVLESAVAYSRMLGLSDDEISGMLTTVVSTSGQQKIATTVAGIGKAGSA